MSHPKVGSGLFFCPKPEPAATLGMGERDGFEKDLSDNLGRRDRAPSIISMG